MDFFAEKNHFSSSTLNNVKKEEDLHDRGAAQLRGMLSQVSNNYNALQMHFVSVMQQQNHKTTDNSQPQEIIKEKVKEKKHDLGGGEGLMFPRQFMDLEPAATTVETNEPSQSSSEGRTPGERSGSPQNNAKVVSKEYPVGQSIIGNGNEIVPFDQDKSSDQVGDGRGAAGKPLT
ncbi:hypothetical protein H6P81_012798 [Aristolochia fimbriata]|uniref:Uncharacterized protein n=1 Tax=Aristolochia fimbriata TaxID=158543 RepID=A0AAV7ECT5_ARIFI|nr:hypothetical protein H6P81_012798 [Aristolochia fimbriata]